MQPIFFNQPLLLGVLVTGLLLWRVLEASIDIRSWNRLRAGAQRQDHGSQLVLLCLVVAGFFLSTVPALQVPGTAITGARELLFWVGILLIYAGMAFRFYAIHVLGRFFTTTVAVAPEQSVIESGPYRLIRHPSYTGLLILFFGYGLCLTNWLSLLVLIGCALIGLGYRIHVEERVLQAQLGQPYQDYMRRTKRLIPFVL
jgi:protein-S-isoprenylcysteine O-methyltransferase Ste14